MAQNNKKGGNQQGKKGPGKVDYKALYLAEKQKNEQREKDEQREYKQKYEKEKARANEPHKPATSADLDERDSDFDLKEGDMVIFQPNHGLMAKTGKDERTLTPLLTYFYQHMASNRIMTYTEKEASLMLKSNHAPYLRILGCSDGSAYRSFIQNCGYKPGDRLPKKEAEKILQDAREAEMEFAKENLKAGRCRVPRDQSVHFDESYPVELRPQFVPPPSEKR